MDLTVDWKAMRSGKFKQGDVVEYIGGDQISAIKGALATVDCYKKGRFGGIYLNIKWNDKLDSGLRRGQMDGGYDARNFRLHKKKSGKKEEVCDIPF